MFTHLHNHTEYSLLDGLSRIKPLVARARQLGMEALAITDHGGLYGAIEFYRECQEVGIKPIIGCEAYLAQGSRRARTAADKNPQHLTILAKDNRGYSNLLQLVTKAYMEGFYYRPRMDKELLERHREGLIVLSGCPSAEVPRLLMESRLAEAREAALWYRDTFEEFFLELQWHDNLPFLGELNEALVALGRELGVPLVATNDCHYVRREEAELQDILVCIQTNTTIHDEKRLKMSDDSYYLRSPQEMEALFAHLPEALENTQRIAQMCKVELDFSTLHLPQFPTPLGLAADAYLERLCWEGYHRRLGQPSAEAEQRLRYELEVIQETHLANYFLVVWDIATFARERGILLGVRGSAAASLALYCLEVTDINPLEYHLVFERFLNKERKEMPDIDMDFQDNRRDEVIEYVVHKYGRDHVAQIITFGTLGAKAALRDVGRALGVAYADVDRVARLIPAGYIKMEQAEIKAWTLDEAQARIPEFREVYEHDQVLRHLIDTARSLEGVVRHASTHAAGVVISQEPLTRYVPLQPPVKGEDQGIAMTQFAMGPIADLGLLKMDFLGLTNLTILSKALDLVAESTGQRLDLRTIPLDDQRTFQLLASGETAGVFQLESAGMRRCIRELKPTSLGNLAAMVALYRPGPMEHIETYIQAKHGRAPIRYPHPTLEEILKETYGVIVYQDQVLLLLQAFAGYSLGEADIVRKAMGKKNAELMRQERQRFILGTARKGFPQEVAEEVFRLIEPFAGYAFNKAHAVSYALIAYWTAYFKANYPVEYMASILNAHLGNTDKTANAVAECRHPRLGIPVLPPDVNHGDAHFRVEEDKEGRRAVRFGLAAIKNVGVSAVEPLAQARSQGGPFQSVEDFCRRANPQGLNRRTLESLIKVGALDSLGVDRGTLLANLSRILTVAQRDARLKQSGQATMFGLFGEAVSTPLGGLELEEAKASPGEKLAWEKELLGVYISENPMSALAFARNTEAIITRADLDTDMAGKRVQLVGQVSSCRKRTTKEGRPFLAATLEFMDGNVEVMAWPDTYEQTAELWQEGALVQVVGKVRVRDEELSISCEEAQEYQIPGGEDTEHPPEALPPQEPPAVAVSPEPRDRPAASRRRQGQDRANGGVQPRDRPNHGVPRRLLIRLRETDRAEEDSQLLEEVLRALLAHQGTDPVRLEIVTLSRTVRRVDMQHVFTHYSPELCQHLEEMLGSGAVTLEEPGSPQIGVDSNSSGGFDVSVPMGQAGGKDLAGSRMAGA